MWIAIQNAVGGTVTGGGGPTPPPYTPPLDDYGGATAAYSVRLLSTSYGAGGGAALRVRRSVPPYDEQDIGFYSDGQLDNQAIIDFATLYGGNDILVVSRWYDQSGQSNHAVQVTPSLQPQIYNGTAVITENGKPAINPTSGFQELDFGIPTSTSGVTGFAVLRQTASAACFINGTSVSNYLGIGQDGSTVTIINQNTGNVSMRKDAATWTPVTRDDFHDGLATGNHLFSFYTDITTDFTDAFGYVGVGTISMMQMQEAIFYPGNEFTSGNLSAIETNINDYYDVSTEYNPDAATSGFLFDYPNAAAAFSVRQLNNNATYCMQVERSDGHTMNIGFVAGDLDTQAIIDFAGASYAKVSRWYDQSSNQSHLESYDPDHQPEIYDGTSIVIDGSYPTINFQRIGGTPKTMTGNINVASLPQPVTYSYVSNLIDASGYGRMGSLGNQAVYTLGLLEAGTFLSVENFAGYDISSVIFDTTSLRRVNGVQTNSGNAGTDAGTNQIVFSSSSPASAWVNGRTQEFIIWGSNQSTAGNISGIEIDQNSYYSVY